jgi:hypothetical protein
LNRQFSEKEIQLANKYMKKCSKSFKIKGMQTKTTLTPVRLAIIKKTTRANTTRGLDFDHMIK